MPNAYELIFFSLLKATTSKNHSSYIFLTFRMLVNTTTEWRHHEISMVERNGQMEKKHDCKVSDFVLKARDKPLLERDLGTSQQFLYTLVETNTCHLLSNPALWSWNYSGAFHNNVPLQSTRPFRANWGLLSNRALCHANWTLQLKQLRCSTGSITTSRAFYPGP